MAIDAIRGYIQLASGLTELSRAKATEAAHAVLMLPAAMTSAPMVTQVTALADELLAAATTNRANLLALVRSEVENAVERAGLVPAADLDRSVRRHRGRDHVQAGALPLRREEARARREVHARLESHLQSAVRLQRVHHLPAASEAEHPQGAHRRRRKVSAAQIGLR